MRYIEDISVPSINEKGKEEGFTTRAFVRVMVRAGLPFNSNFDGMRMAERIYAACEKDGPFIGLDSADWEKLTEYCRNPQPQHGFTAYPLNPSHMCMKLLEAVFNAKTSVAHTKLQSAISKQKKK